MQSCIYNLLRDSGNEAIHDELGFKYFCFSNLFPFKPKTDFVVNQTINLLVSSPRKEIIYSIAGILTQRKSLQIGNYFFEVMKTKILNPYLNENDTLITATPVNISISSDKFEKYCVKSQKSSIHWTNKMPLNAFIESLEHNLIHKYNKFYDKNFELSGSLFKSFKFKNFALVPYNTAKIAASYWEFEPNLKSMEYKKLFGFVLDTGFGQRNSAGFGFMNIKK